MPSGLFRVHGLLLCPDRMLTLTTFTFLVWALFTTVWYACISED